MRARIAIAGLACTATARLDYGLNPDLSGCSAVATSSNFQCMSSIEAVVRSTASWNKQVQYEQPTTDAWIDRCIETSAIGLPFALIPVVYAQVSLFHALYHTMFDIYCAIANQQDHNQASGGSSADIFQCVLATRCHFWGR